MLVLASLRLVMLAFFDSNYITFSFTYFFILQNVLQCESACQTNKRKRKAGDAFGEGYNYLVRSRLSRVVFFRPELIHCFLQDYHRTQVNSNITLFLPGLLLKRE